MLSTVDTNEWYPNTTFLNALADKIMLAINVFRSSMMLRIVSEINSGAAIHAQSYRSILGNPKLLQLPR